MLSIKEIKRNMVAETASLKIDRAALLTKQTVEKLYAKLRKGAGQPANTHVAGRNGECAERSSAQRPSGVGTTVGGFDRFI